MQLLPISEEGDRVCQTTSASPSNAYPPGCQNVGGSASRFTSLLLHSSTTWCRYLQSCRRKAESTRRMNIDALPLTRC